MSEKVPKENPEDSPEKRKFRDECMNCDINFGLNRYNTFGVAYEVDQHCNHLHVTCPDCNHQYRVFCSSETIDLAIENEVHINPKIRTRDPDTGEIISEERVGGKYAPPEVIEMWWQVYGIEPVEPVEISPRHEQQIKAFGETITAMLEQDPDGFWEDMGLPHDGPYPLKWN